MAASQYALKILTFAFTDDTKKTVEIRWDWAGLAGTERDYTDKFEVNVRYHVVNGAGERRIDREEPATTVTAIPGETEYVYYWPVPDRCIEVEMTVIAYSKTYNSNGNNVPYWDIGLTKKVTTPNWLYCGEAHKPDKAATPTITRNPRLGSQVILELSGIREEEGNNKDVCKVEFQVLSLDGPIDEGTILTGTNEAVVSEFNTCRYVMSIGKSYGYKFRARYWAGKPGEFSKITGDPWAANASPIVDIPGAWSDFTELVNGAPNSPKILSIKKENRTQVRFTLERSGYLHHYQFQCASTTEAFTRMDTWETEHPDLIENQEARAAAEAIDPPILDEFNVLGDVEEILHDTTKFVGGRIFFRVRAVSAETEGFYSGWSEIVEFKYADEIRRPVTWMNTPYASVGDNTIALNIMHNSPTNTQTTGAQIMFHFNSGATRYYPAAGIIEPPSNGNVYQVPFPLTDYAEEGVIWWCARTAEFGEEGQDERNWSPWSESIEFWIYERPVIDISFPDVPQNEWTDVNIENESTTVPIISQFPLHFLVTPTLSGDQSITSYLIRIIALDAYAEYDGYGNKKFINKGEVLYSIYDNSSRGATDKYVNVTDCNLVNGIRYRLSVAAYVNTGAHTEATADFLVQIPEADYTIEATVSQNSENVSMIINPRAVKYESTGFIPDEPIVIDNIEFDPDYRYVKLEFDYTVALNTTLRSESATTDLPNSGITISGGGYWWQRFVNIRPKTPVASRLYAATFEIKEDNGLSDYYTNYLIQTDKGYRDGTVQSASFNMEPRATGYTAEKADLSTNGSAYTSETNTVYYNNSEAQVANLNNQIGATIILDQNSDEPEVKSGTVTCKLYYCFDSDESGYDELLAAYPNHASAFDPLPPPVTERVFVNSILLSIYRKNQDGTMVEIAKDVPNQDSVFIKDPHPNLMKLVYRIVGRNVLTGAIAFVDTPEYKMDCTDIILQWDENTHFMDVTENDLPSEYSGNIVRLPYNIDVSESANIDNNMVKYIGRKDPVSYYGTHTGYTANWNTEIPKYDRDTIALLRKLQVYPGDVYVREPSGTGYWAHVTVTFPINHCALTVPISLSITRVEGGM